MIKCKVFRTDWNNKNDLGPVHHFNKFCEENPNIDVIKIDTINVGINNSDLNIFLYYKELEDKRPDKLDFHGFKSGDLAYYIDGDQEIIVEILSVVDNNRARIAYIDKGSRTYALIFLTSLAPVFEQQEVSNYKIGDAVIYKTNCKEYEAVILRTGFNRCIIKYNGNIVETSYCYIDKE